MAGIALMLAASLMGAIDAVIVRLIASDVHPFMMVLTRSLFGLLFFMPWLISRPQVLRSHYRFRHALRAILKLASLIAFFTAYTHSQLADVTAIAFTTPIFVTIGAWMFLAESPQLFRVMAVITGFAGAIIVISPGHQFEAQTGLLLALLGALLTALIQLILKPMAARDSTETLLAWNLIITVPLAAIPALFYWSAPSATQWALLILQGFVGLLAMSCVTRAFSLAEASLLVPLDFLRLPIVAALAFYVFRETVPLTTWLGGAVIFAASLLMANSVKEN
ncbi:hypothetical protein AB833_31685 [Chromatiales bacterium (ex Bugula neritina AB1)]|nr:hypothetical protein AB833_31685 [Chromatiales bacterium (ex Bugula neritina AB1)]